MENKSGLLNRDLFKKGDLIIILVILLFGCIIFLISRQPVGDKLTAVIYDNGKVFKTVNLDEVAEPYDITVNEQNNLIVRVEKGKIRYISSDCHDKVCINSGWLSKQGDFAACAPFRSAISISGQIEGGEDPDFILN